ncbi:MAG: NUDIX hydrolase [Anaerolineae bacterium]
MLIKPWKTLSSREIYQNKWMRLREDVAEMPDGRSTIYGVIECADCVGVLPFVDDDHVVMVRQFRYVFGEDHRWEMPTGGVKPGETAEFAARRELQEEAGYNAAELRHVSTYFTSKSIMREVGHLYIGRHLTKVEAAPDDTEFFEIAVMPFNKVLQMVNASEIRDSMTVITVLHAARLKESNTF